MVLSICYELADGSSEAVCGRNLELADLKDCDDIWLAVFHKEKEVGQV